MSVPTREDILAVMGQEGYVEEDRGGVSATRVRIPPRKHRPMRDEPVLHQDDGYDIVEEAFERFFGV